MSGILRKWTKLCPLFLIEWWLKTNNYQHATLSFGNYKINCQVEEMYDGVFICYSKKQMLEIRKRRAEHILEQINDELESC